MYVTGTADPRWADALDQFRAQPARRLEVRGRQARHGSPPVADRATSSSRRVSRRPSESRTGTNFACDSASSASGSESATMPQPAKSRTRAARRSRPSAARCPTRRRRRRPSSRPGRRSGRGPCPRSPRSGAVATGVGVPPTAAEGCSASASSSEETVAASWTTPATSVARCMTLGRCSTNGASGTFIDEQCGSSASATERTAYSCSSRSFDERASVRGQGQVAVVVAGTPDGAGQHPRGDQAALAAHQHLGGGAEHAVDVEGPARSGSARPAGAAASARRSAPSAVATRSRASTTFSRSPALIRATASATTRHPLLAVEGAVGEDHVRRAPRWRGGGERRVPALASVPMVVTQVRRRRGGRRRPAGRRAPSRRARRRTRRSRSRPGRCPARRPRRATGGAGGGLGPPLVGVGEAGRAAGAQLGGDAPADQARRRGAAR